LVKQKLQQKQKYFTQRQPLLYNNGKSLDAELATGIIRVALLPIDLLMFTNQRLHRLAPQKRFCGSSIYCYITGKSIKG